MDLINNPAIIGLIVAIPSFLLGLLAYKRSVHVDEVTEQSGIVTSQSGAVQQVIDGLNKIVANLQEDNKLLREQLVNFGTKFAELVAERDGLKRDMAALSKKYGVNNNHV